MTTQHEASAAKEKAAVSPTGSGGSAAGASTGAVKLPLDMQGSFEAYAELRAKGPVAGLIFDAGGDKPAGEEAPPELRAFLGREHLVVSRYDEVLSVLLDGRFSSDIRTAMTPEQREKMPPVPEEFRPIAHSLVALDPPDHSRLRKLIQPSFSSRMMDAMRPRIQKIADDLVDKAERAAQERGEARPDRRIDLIGDFAYPLPVTVISDMLGIPLEDREQVRGWTENLLRADLRRSGGMDPESLAKIRQFIAYLRELFVAKRRRPTDDVITQLLQAEEDGDKLNEDEVLSTVFLLYLAGHVTTVNLIGNGVFALLRNPRELAKLKADPGLVSGTVEETLRYWGPAEMISARIAKEDINLGGTRIPKGEPVMVVLASANHDPAHFEDPEAFDITRANADRHVAFGKGIHLCVGAPLARLEGRLAFETLLRRLPDMRLAVPPEEVRWNPTLLRGLPKLPLLF
jgi:cytochrome P450